jgi:hypothetical protein
MIKGSRTMGCLYFFNQSLTRNERKIEQFAPFLKTLEKIRENYGRNRSRIRHQGNQ